MKDIQGIRVEEMTKEQMIKMLVIADGEPENFYQNLTELEIYKKLFAKIYYAAKEVTENIRNIVEFEIRKIENEAIVVLTEKNKSLIEKVNGLDKHNKKSTEKLKKLAEQKKLKIEDLKEKIKKIESKESLESKIQESKKKLREEVEKFHQDILKKINTLKSNQMINEIESKVKIFKENSRKNEESNVKIEENFDISKVATVYDEYVARIPNKEKVINILKKELGFEFPAEEDIKKSLIESNKQKLQTPTKKYINPYESLRMHKSSKDGNKSGKGQSTEETNIKILNSVNNDECNKLINEYKIQILVNKIKESQSEASIKFEMLKNYYIAHAQSEKIEKSIIITKLNELLVLKQDELKETNNIENACDYIKVIMELKLTLLKNICATISVHHGKDKSTLIEAAKRCYNLKCQDTGDLSSQESFIKQYNNTCEEVIKLNKKIVNDSNKLGVFFQKPIDTFKNKHSAKFSEEELIYCSKLLQEINDVKENLVKVNNFSSVEQISKFLTTFDTKKSMLFNLVIKKADFFGEKLTKSIKENDEILDTNSDFNAKSLELEIAELLKEGNKIEPVTESLKTLETSLEKANQWLVTYAGDLECSESNNLEVIN